MLISPKKHTILFAMMIPTATAKLNVNATLGPQNRCCWRLAPSEPCISLYKELRNSSSARPDKFNSSMSERENLHFLLISAGTYESIFELS
jgi:hypothetical protein